MLTLAAAIAIATSGTYPACAAGQLTLSFDGENGAFNGMSHGGALLVVRNIGPAACRLPRQPMLTFVDARDHALPIVRQVPKLMHPGPVVLPVAVAAGAELTAPLRWVSGAVYPQSRCFRVAGAALTIGGEKLAAPLGAHVCGEAGRPVTFEQPPLSPDPVLKANP